jgi:hypothetical protein
LSTALENGLGEFISGLAEFISGLNSMLRHFPKI